MTTMNLSRIAGLGLLVLLPGCSSMPGLGPSGWSYGYPEPLALVGPVSLANEFGLRLQGRAPALAATAPVAAPLPRAAAPILAPAAPQAAPVAVAAPAPAATAPRLPYDHRTDPYVTAVLQPMTVPIPAGTNGRAPRLPPVPKPEIVDLGGVHAALEAAAD